MTRPTWDEYFMEIAGLVAKRSTCLRRQVGALLVRDKRILVTGYNGAPPGLSHCQEVGCLREELTEKFMKIFEEVDVIIMATTPSTAFSFKELESENKIFQYEGDIFTVPFSLCGLPALSVPFGEVNNMPYNIQLIGKKYEDDNLIEYAEKISKCLRGDEFV